MRWTNSTTQAMKSECGSSSRILAQDPTSRKGE